MSKYELLTIFLSRYVEKIDMNLKTQEFYYVYKIHLQNVFIISEGQVAQAARR